jgi:hypothetical protein
MEKIALEALISVKKYFPIGSLIYTAPHTGFILRRTPTSAPVSRKYFNHCD